MIIKLDALSRFKSQIPIVFNNQETFGFYKRQKFLNREELTEDEIIQFKVQPQHAGRPDRIAEDVYGSLFLEWIVIMFNNPRNTLNYPANNSVIELPNSQVVFGSIL